MSYSPTLPPNIVDTTALLTWFNFELRRVAEALEGPTLIERGSPPQKPENGRLYFADGTGWNPGSGRGVYQYRDGGVGYAFLG